jgi:hypothetical protein
MPRIDCHRDTSGEAAGKDVASLALHDPAQARKLFDLLMNALADPVARRGVARAFAQALPHDLLRRLAESTDGRALLEGARAELKSDLGDDTNEWASAQIDSALKSAALRSDPAFQNLDPATQQDVLARVDYPFAKPEAVDNCIALAKSPAFQAASPPLRKELLAALAQHPADPIFRQGLEGLASNPALARLTPAQQARAIKAFETVAGRASYQGTPGSLFSIGTKAVSDADKRQILANAQRVVTSPGFQAVGAAAQRAMMDALDEQPASAGHTGRLLKLTDAPGFAALNDAVKQVDLLDAYGSQAPFRDAVDTLVTSGRFTSLHGAQQAQVLADIAKLHETASYTDAKGADRQAMVEIVGDISAQAAANPSNTTLRNTLHQVLDGKVKLAMYQREPFDSHGRTAYNYGFQNDGGIHLNIDPRVRAHAVANNQYVDTLAHETNHMLNGTTTAGTVDRFLDEYRAAITGMETALGRKLTPAEEKAIVDNLVDGTNSDYSHLADLYNNDAKFKAVVDGMYTTLSGSTDAASGATTAPATIDAEDARARLRSADEDNSYLKKAGNLDNR